MTFLHMLAPEDLALEEFGAFRNSTAELGLVLALYPLLEFLVESVIQWSATELVEIGSVGFQKLEELKSYQYQF